MARTVSVPGSTRPATAAARPIGPADRRHRTTVTVYVRRNPALAPARSPFEQAWLGHSARRYLTHEQAAVMQGADPGDLDAVVRFANERKLTVVERSETKRLVQLSGTVGALGRAFDVELMHYAHPDGAYRSHADAVKVPVALGRIVEGVLGLDNRKMARSYRRAGARLRAGVGRSAARASAGGPKLPPNTYLPPAVAKLFNLPPADGTGESVAVFAFNGAVMSSGTSTAGGYDAGALSQYFENVIGQSAPTIADVVVQGPGNQPGDGSDPNDATGEVLLDLCVVGSVAPGAKIAVYFTEFTEEGWVNAIKAAVTDTNNKPSVISISYGNPEDDEQQGLWMEQAVQLVNDAFEQAAAPGHHDLLRPGDNGAADEPGRDDRPRRLPRVEPVGAGLSAEPAWKPILTTGRSPLNRSGTTSPRTRAPRAEVSAVCSRYLHGRPAPASRRTPTAAARPAGACPTSPAVADPETPLWVLGPDGKLGCRRRHECRRAAVVGTNRAAQPAQRRAPGVLQPAALRAPEGRPVRDHGRQQRRRQLSTATRLVRAGTRAPVGAGPTAPGCWQALSPAPPTKPRHRRSSRSDSWSQRSRL